MEPVSVIIPLYNKEKHIERAVLSVLNQTVQPFEIIIVDDGSTDRSAAVVQSMHDSRIRLVSQQNKGVSAARNRGIHEAKNEFLAFLDADDAWKPDFLESILNLRKLFPEAGLYATAYETSHEKTGINRITYRGIPPEPWAGIIPDFFDAMLGQPPVWSSAAAIPRHVFDKAGYFQEGEVLAEDVDMWCRIALQFPVAFNSHVCATYFLDSENRAYVKGAKHKKAFGYLNTLSRAIADPSLPESTRKNIAVLKEMVELGYATSLLFGHDAFEARRALKAYEFHYLKRQKTFWYMMSFLPVGLVDYLMGLKSRLLNIFRFIWK